ncbi:Hsp70 family protein [Actinoplanes sp. NPDC051861]|uniref:Hsp70 family protein n=1 Tax=Actinoplanes sp. NPDC051861 TaxID=3155170 RepID=UPI0034254FDD
MTAEYGLGIDLGTTHTAAAVLSGGRAESVRLGTRRMEIPSAVFVKDDGGILVGEAAERRGQDEPARLAREFKRRLGDPVPILAGGVPFSAHALTAKLLRHVLDTVTRQHDGPPSRVALTYPAHWGPYKREQLDQAIRLADAGPVRLLTEPEAVARRHGMTRRIGPGETVVVYDLGGGTFDVAVLRREEDGFALLGTPEGVELGGADFDEAVYAHMLGAVDSADRDSLDRDDPETAPALARLRRDCVEAKESLSFDSEVTVPVALPGRYARVRLQRSEFEAMIAPSVRDTVDATRRALRSAGVEASGVSAILLSGGSSRIPMIARVLGAEFNRPVMADSHPEHAVALGAAVSLDAVAAVVGAPSPAASSSVAPAAAAGPATTEAAVPGPVTTAAAATEPAPTEAATGAAEPSETVEAAPEPARTAPANGASAAATPSSGSPAERLGLSVRPAPKQDFTDLRTPSDPWAAAEAAEAADAAARLAAAIEAEKADWMGGAGAATVPVANRPAVADRPTSVSARPAPDGAEAGSGGEQTVPASRQPTEDTRIAEVEPSTQFIPATYSPAPPPVGRKPDRRRRILVIAGAVVLVLAASATGVILADWNKSRAKDTPTGGPSTGASASAAGPSAMPSDVMLIRMDTGGDMGADDWKPRIQYFDPVEGTRRDLAGTEVGDVLPRWSHNREQIALTNRSGGNNAIYVMNKDGGDRRLLIDGVTGGRVAWSADDTKLAYVKQVGKVNQIFVIPVAGGEPKQLTRSKSPKDDPVWSADGASIIYWAERDGTRSIFDLTVDAPEEPGRPITDAALGDAVDPALSVDGEQVLFTKQIDQDNTDVWLVGTDGSDPHVVASGPGREMDPTWAPKDDWFAFVRGDLNHPQIVVQRADGTGEKALTTGSAREGHPCWF